MNDGYISSTADKILGQNKLKVLSRAHSIDKKIHFTTNKGQHGPRGHRECFNLPTIVLMNLVALIFIEEQKL